MTTRSGMVWIVCTDRGTHPRRELGRLLLEDDPEWKEILLELVGTTGDDGEAITMQDVLALYDHERLSSTGSRLAKRRLSGGSNDSVNVAPVVSRDVVGSRTWRFRCPTCRRDVPLSSKRLAPVIETLLTHGITSLDISSKDVLG